jgi:hypothetical protein
MYDSGESIMNGNLSDGITLENGIVTSSNLMDFIGDDSGTLIYNQASIDDGSLEAATDGLLRMSGVLNIANSGDYTFRVSHDDGFDIRIDGQSVFDYNGITPVGISEGTISLDAGSHDVEILYWDQGGAYVFDLELIDSNGNNVWTANNLSYTESGMIDVRDDSEITLNLAQNDYDVDSDLDLSSIVVTSQPAHGSVVINQDGTVTYNPDDDYNGIDTFNYTIKDAEGNVSNEATVTLNVTPSIAQNAIVYEAGLDNGTDHSLPTVAEGNLLGNDGGSIVSIEGIKNGKSGDLDSSNNTITVATDNGEITVYRKAADGHEIGDYIYTLKNASSDGDNAVDSIEYKFKQGGNTQTSTLDINIVDDAPIGNDIVKNLQSTESSSQTTNLVIVLDKSGSMAWDIDGHSSNDSSFDSDNVRMDIAKTALKSMFDAYDDLGNVNVQFVTFSSSVTKSAWYIDDVNSANEYLDNVTPNGGTQYDTALNETMDNYTEPVADKTLVYFISDGEPNDSHGVDSTVTYENKTGKDAWEQFLQDKGIDISFSIGITSSTDISTLEPIAYPENIDGVTEPYAMQLTNPLDLESTLLDTVDQAVVKGDASVLMNSGEDGIILGADGGTIESVLVDGQTYIYDSSNTTQVIPTSHGGEFKVNFETGEYEYKINPTQNISGEQEVFTITAIDGDGDSITKDLTINLDLVANLDANRDVVLTNKVIDDNSGINDSLLLFNDSGADSVMSKTSLVRLSESDFNSGDWTVTDGANITNNTFETAFFVERSFFGDETGTYANNVNQDGPTSGYLGNISQASQQDWLKVSLAEGEKLFLDIDNSELYTNVKIADSSGNIIDSISENSGGPYGSFQASYTGDYFVVVEGDNDTDTGSYQLYMSVDTSDANYDSVTYDYTIGNDTVNDTATVDVSYQTGDTVQGTDGDEILIGRDGVADTLDGGAGDDTLVYDVSDTIDGGAGYDTLFVESSSLSLDLSNVSNIEEIHLDNFVQPNTDSINLTDIFSSTESNATEFNITGSGELNLHVDNATTTLTDKGTDTQGNHVFEAVYNNETIILHVNDDITIHQM